MRKVERNGDKRREVQGVQGKLSPENCSICRKYKKCSKCKKEQDSAGKHRAVQGSAGKCREVQESAGKCR